MATWEQFEIEAEELALAVRARFEATKHHVLATLRADGSPRVSGTEVGFTSGNLTMGSMAGALKALDLQKDSRCALHANPGDGSMEGGDAKVSGRAIETANDGSSHSFTFDISEVVLTSIGGGGDHLLIQVWNPGCAVREIKRH